MQAQKSFIPAIFHSALKRHPKGSLVPDQVIKFVLEQSCNHCLRGKYLVTDTIATWLTSECDFTNSEVADFLATVRNRILEEVGVELLFPGSPIPEEMANSTPKEDEVELEAVEDADDWGTEWDGNPIEEEQNEKEEMEKSPSQGKIVTTPETNNETFTPPLQRENPLMPLGVEEAVAILEKIASGKSDVDPLYFQIVQDNQLLGYFEKNLFTNVDIDFKEVELLKKGLGTTFILEHDYAYYAGTRKVENITLKEAIRQSKILLESTKEIKKALNKLAQSSSQEGRYGDAGAINTVLEKLLKSEAKLDEIVSTLSSVPVKEEEQVIKPTSAPALPTEKRRTLPPRKSALVSDKQSSRQEKIKIALAFLFMITVIVGVALFLNNLFNKKTTLKVYNPVEFSSIVQLTEARRQGTAFIGVVNATYWNNLSPEDKKAKAENLLQTVKNSDIHGILLMTSDGRLVAQSYGEEIRIYK